MSRAELNVQGLLESCKSRLFPRDSSDVKRECAMVLRNATILSQAPPEQRKVDSDGFVLVAGKRKRSKHASPEDLVLGKKEKAETQSSLYVRSRTKVRESASRQLENLRKNFLLDVERSNQLKK